MITNITDFLKQKSSSIYYRLANRYNIPVQVIEVICNSPFKFTTKIIGSADDEKDILFAYLFKIKIKKYAKGKNKSNAITRE